MVRTYNIKGTYVNEKLHPREIRVNINKKGICNKNGKLAEISRNIKENPNYKLLVFNK